MMNDGIYSRYYTDFNGNVALKVNHRMSNPNYFSNKLKIKIYIFNLFKSTVITRAFDGKHQII